MNQNMVIQKQPITCHSFKVLRTRELTAWNKILLKKKRLREVLCPTRVKKKRKAKRTTNNSTEEKEVRRN